MGFGDSRADADAYEPVVLSHYCSSQQWNWAGPLLLRTGVVSEIDPAALEDYCIRYSGWLLYEQVIGQLTVLVQRGK